VTEKDATVTNANGAHVEHFLVEQMRLEDVSEVSRVEHRCFTNPWPESAYRRELRNPEGNFYIVLRQIEQSTRATAETEPRGRLSLLPLIRKSERPSTHPIVGFSGMWFLYDESHVTTIGVTPELRGHGLGEVLLVSLFDEALRRNAQWVTLEVRVSNASAQALYEKYGFTRQGVRRRYYSDNGEDAYIMWSPSLHDPDYLTTFQRLKNTLRERLARESILVETTLS
jgi:ribosomal-protein-alanine N-acetyltransferase